MNMALLERHAHEVQPPSALDWLFVGGIIAAIAAVALIPALVMYWLVTCSGITSEAPMSSVAMVSSVPANRIFLLSPANCGGTRAKQALSPNAKFALAVALRSAAGAPLGDLFAFMSGLYFRGKLTYARRFARPAEPDNPIVGCGIHIITANAGLRSPDTLVTRAAVQAFGRGEIDAGNASYRRPLEASARALFAEIGSECDVVLLGSIASPKYVDILAGVFGDRLQFPIAFVGRGDMSRGGLLLRHASAGVELDYVPVVGALRRGARPPKLAPLRNGRSADH